MLGLDLEPARFARPAGPALRDPHVLSAPAFHIPL